MWRAQSGRGFVPVARQTITWDVSLPFPHRVIKKSLCNWWLQYLQYLAQSDCLATDRQGQRHTRLTLTPSVIPNYNYVIMVSDWKCLKYFCIYIYIYMIHLFICAPSLRFSNVPSQPYSPLTAALFFRKSSYSGPVRLKTQQVAGQIPATA
jgi:hypothetical protein